MTNDSQQIVNKAWNFAHVLRDDGLSYMTYTEQITFLLFLKVRTSPGIRFPSQIDCPPKGLQNGVETDRNRSTRKSGVAPVGCFEPTGVSKSQEVLKE